MGLPPARSSAFSAPPDGSSAPVVLGCHFENYLAQDFEDYLTHATPGLWLFGRGVRKTLDERSPQMSGNPGAEAPNRTE